MLACEGYCLCGVDVAAPHQLRYGTKPLLQTIDLMRPQLVDSEVGRALQHQLAPADVVFSVTCSCILVRTHAPAQACGCQPGMQCSQPRYYADSSRCGLTSSLQNKPGCQNVALSLAHTAAHVLLCLPLYN